MARKLSIALTAALLVAPISLGVGTTAALPVGPSAQVYETARVDSITDKGCRKLHIRFSNGIAKNKRKAKAHKRAGHPKPRVSIAIYRKKSHKDRNRDGLLCPLTSPSGSGVGQDPSTVPSPEATPSPTTPPVAPEPTTPTPNPTVGLPPTVSPGGGGLTVSVVNRNPAVANNQIWVSATGNGDSEPEVSLADRSTFKLADISSGRVWVTMGEPLSSEVFPSPDTSPIRFDVVELTYPGVANLSAVDMLGIPMDIETFDVDGEPVAAKRWACYTDVISERVSANLSASGGDFDKIQRRDDDGGFLRLVSPNISSGLNPSGYPTFETYVASLLGQPLTIRGTAMGLTYHYTGAFAFDANDPDGPGSLILTDQGADELGQIYVAGSSLVGNSTNETNGIYGNNSPYYVDGDLHSGNDVYGAVYRDLVAGFTYGFWGSPEYANDSGNFDVSAEPGPFQDAQPEHPHYNVWAAALWPLTDAYGFPYGDTFNHDERRNPIVGLPTDGTLRITINPDVSPPNCS